MTPSSCTDVEQIVGRERRERVSQLAWCGGGCFDSRRRVNSTVGPHLGGCHVDTQGLCHYRNRLIAWFRFCVRVLCSLLHQPGDGDICLAVSSLKRDRGKRSVLVAKHRS